MISIIQEGVIKKWTKRAAIVGVSALAITNPEKFGKTIRGLGKLGSKKWFAKFEKGLQNNTSSNNVKK